MLFLEVDVVRAGSAELSFRRIVGGYADDVAEFEEDAVKARLTTALLSLSLLAAACEDEGNPGDDSLLSGGSLVIVLLIAVVIGAVLFARRR